jgi:hypothetical protein
MFGTNHLLHDGAQTEGVILESHVTNTITKTRVVIAVKFEDGETEEFSEDLVDHFEPPSHSLHGIAGNLTGANVIPMLFTTGSRIPVRYDASNHKQIAVDVPALQARVLEEWTAAQAASRAKALASLDSPAPSGATPLDPDLQALMDAEEASRNSMEQQ